MSEQKGYGEIQPLKSNGLPGGLKNTLEHHLIKRNSLSIYRKSIEREIDTLQKMIDTIKKFIKEKGLE